MSYDLVVFAKSSKIPTLMELQRHLEETGGALEIPLTGSLTSLIGYVPFKKGDKTGGFEVYTGPITQEELQDYREDLEASGDDPQNDEYLSVLTENDLSITFSCKNNWEIALARWVAASLAALSNCAIYDPQTGELSRVT